MPEKDERTILQLVKDAEELLQKGWRGGTDTLTYMMKFHTLARQICQRSMYQEKVSETLEKIIQQLRPRVIELINAESSFKAEEVNIVKQINVLSGYMRIWEAKERVYQSKGQFPSWGPQERPNIMDVEATLKNLRTSLQKEIDIDRIVEQISQMLRTLLKQLKKDAEA